VRPGEKLHELLINSDEMRYAWEYENLYMILNWQFDQAYLNKNYSGIKKFDNVGVYSSNNTERLTNDELKNNIVNLKLL
jgi:FlaA1/EpsC-like NDP-sugar epimerase